MAAYDVSLKVPGLDARSLVYVQQVAELLRLSHDDASMSNHDCAPIPVAQIPLTTHFTLQTEVRCWGQVCINLKIRRNLEPQGRQEADCELDDWEATGSICSRLITGTATLPDAEADCKHMQWSEELGSQGDEHEQVQEVGATKRGTLRSHRCPNLLLELP